MGRAFMEQKRSHGQWSRYAAGERAVAHLGADVASVTVAVNALLRSRLLLVPGRR